MTEIPGPGQNPPELPQDWVTARHLVNHPELRGTIPREVQDVADYLAGVMTVDSPDPVAAKDEMVGLFRQTSEEGGPPRPVRAYRPDLASVVVQFYTELKEAAKDDAIEDELRRILDDKGNNE